MGMNERYRRYSLDMFESLDVEGADSSTADELKGELEREIVTRMSELPGWQAVEEAVAGLNRNGHRLERHETDAGWIAFYQETNDGTRDFWIHATREEGLPAAGVSFFEKLEVQAARRLEGLSEAERAQAELVDRFYEQGLGLTVRGEDASLTDSERLHLALYRFETGVNNGGFRTYISNTEGAQLADCVRFLEAVGARDLAAVVRDVLTLFPSGFAAGMTEEIWKVLEEEESALDDLDTRFYATTDNLAKLVMMFVADGGAR